MLIVTLCVSKVAAQPPDPESTLAQIVRDWEGRRDAVRTVEYRCAGKHVVVKGTLTELLREEVGPGLGEVPASDHESDVELTVLLDFEKNRARKEIAREVFSGVAKAFARDCRVAAFNGSEIRLWRPLDRNRDRGEFAPELYLKPERYAGLFFELWDVPLFLAHGVFNGFDNAPPAASPLLRSRLDSSLFRVHAHEMHERRGHIVLRTSPSDANVESFADIWVDVERQSAVSRVMRYVDATEIFRCDIDYQHVSGMWLPKSWKIVTTAGGQIDAWEQMEVVGLAVNPTFSAEQFEIDVRPGMIVADERGEQRRRYRVGEHGAQVDVEMLEAQQKVGFSRGILVAAVTGLIGFVVAISLLLQRRRRRSVSDDRRYGDW